MPNTFFHGPDDTITVGPTGAGFTMSLAEFLVEEPDYVLPVGPIWQIYYDGDVDNPAYHVFSDGHTSSPGVMPWPEGDDYNANWATYQTNVLAARAAAADPPPTDAEKADAILDRPEWDSLVEALATRFSIPKATLHGEIRAILVAHPGL